MSNWVNYGWVRGSIAARRMDGLLQVLRCVGVPQSEERGRYGYTHSYRYPAGIAVYYSLEGTNSRHITLDIPGQGVEYLESRGFAGGVPELLRQLDRLEFRCSRIDLSIDWEAADISGAANLVSAFAEGSISAYSSRGDGGRTLKTAIYAQGGTVDGEGDSPVSATISFGSRTSENYYRLYHKGAERYLSSKTPLEYRAWIEQRLGRDLIRLEGEYKGATAVAVQAAMRERGYGYDCIQGILAGGVTFRGALGEQIRAALQAEPIGIRLERRPPTPSVVKSLRWIETQVVPTLAALTDLADQSGMRFGEWLSSKLREASLSCRGSSQNDILEMQAWVGGRRIGGLCWEIGV